MDNNQLDFFKTNGYVVIENFLSPDQVNLTRSQLHETLKKYSIDHDKIINFEESAPNNIRIKSDISNIFYSKFKMDIHLSESAYKIWKCVMETIDEFPFGTHSDVLPYIDRICWRLPDIIKAEGGLGLHIDRRPGSDGFKNIKKYRPIQGFVALTDHYGSESGGLKLVKGFHKKFTEYFDKDTNKNDWGTSGEFYRLGSKSYASLQKLCEPIDIPAGSMVLWDNRLPHATCEKLSGFDTREVIYMSYIPNVPLNIKYVQEQANNLKKNIQPPSYLKLPVIQVDRDYSIDELNEFQLEKLLLK